MSMHRILASLILGCFPAFAYEVSISVITRGLLSSDNEVNINVESLVDSTGSGKITVLSSLKK